MFERDHASVTETDAGGRAVIEVIDTGAGIPEGYLPRIFEPFFITKPVGSGTGLGLSVCHGIVATLGGEISAENREGSGAKLRIVLPSASEGAEPVQAARARPVATPSAEPRAQVLVVDDEPLVGELIGRVLGPKHEVSVTSSGEQALAEVEGGRHFDLILCDLMMPVMTGVELYARVHEVALEQARRMVFMTGGAFTEEAKESLDGIPIPRWRSPLPPRSCGRRCAARSPCPPGPEPAGPGAAGYFFVCWKTCTPRHRRPRCHHGYRRAARQRCH